MYGHAGQDDANAQLARLNEQIARLNEQIAAEPARIAAAVLQAEHAARAPRRSCATCARHPAMVGSLYCRHHQPPKYLP